MGKLHLTWDYNGCAPWEEIVAWCEEHIENEWTARRDFGIVFFYTEEDETMFLLRWGGK